MDISRISQKTLFADSPLPTVVRTINLLVTNQDLHCKLPTQTLRSFYLTLAATALSVYLPGVDGGDIWDLHNPNLYFAEELFSNSTTNVHACIPEALAKMIGIKTLTIGYTRDIELAEKVARATGAVRRNEAGRRHSDFECERAGGMEEKRLDVGGQNGKDDANGQSCEESIGG